MNLEPILETHLDDSTKGIPGGTAPFRLRDMARQGWNVLREDLPLPLMVLKQAALEHNSAAFKAYLGTHQLSFAPHGKTTMAPQLFARQLADGAWGLTAATVNQVQVYRRFGVQRILLANQLLGRAHVRYVAQELNRDADFDFYAIVDSSDQARHVAGLAREFQLRRPIQVLVELGIPGGRSGCRSVEAGLETARAIVKEQDVLALCGIEGFEGILAARGAEAREAVDTFLGALVSLLGRIPDAWFGAAREIILSAGGTAYFDRVAAILGAARHARPVRVVVRSGCYLTFDHGAYHREQDLALSQKRAWCAPLKPALEIWAYVQSLPEPGLALLTMGKRDCPYDAGLPVPQRRWRPSSKKWADLPGAEIFSTNDQHAFMRVPAGLDLAVGDMIASGISHPCTAFDKWRLVPVVNQAYDVVEGVLTYF